MPRRFQVTVDGHTYEVEVSELTDASAPALKPASGPVAEKEKASGATPLVDKERAPGARPLVEKERAQPPARTEAQPAAAAAGTVTAPLPGVALEVKVAVGDRVSAGDVLVILEAMKMENEVVAREAGVVQSVHVVPGASVASGDPLVTIG